MARNRFKNKNYWQIVWLLWTSGWDEFLRRKCEAGNGFVLIWYGLKALCLDLLNLVFRLVVIIFSLLIAGIMIWRMDYIVRKDEERQAAIEKEVDWLHR